MARVSDDLPCFPYTLLGVDVLEGGKLTSDDVLGCLNYSLQGFPVESGAVPIPGSDAASQDALHSASVELSEEFWAQTEFLQSPVEEEMLVGLRHYWLCVNSPGEVRGTRNLKLLTRSTGVPSMVLGGCSLLRFLKSTTSSLVLLMFRERLLLWHQLVRVCTSSL